MPPKKNQPAAKTNDKNKKKQIEDKTFGLKNKNKSAKVNRYVQQVEQQVLTAGNSKKLKEAEERKNLVSNKKEAEARKKAELAELFKPVLAQQKVPFGVDPKTVLCAHFKQGTCTKGDRCKFSHDLKIDRKATKIDMYTDARDDKESDTMDSWDQSKLESVVNSKLTKNSNITDIVCKHFLQAIEDQKYGWFWECPNGGPKCQYRHALPKGFILKSKKAQLAEEEAKNQISLEDFLETERHNLGSNLTPVTLETFTQWKKDRRARKEAAEEAEHKAKEAAFKAGRAVNMSGRDFFDFNPELLQNGEDEEGDVFEISQYQNRADEEGHQQPSTADADREADPTNDGTRLAEQLENTSLTA
ncbi:Translation machinery-associated protein 46 [Dimargaris cristalligena]|uniref:C3H1-type domain-containing protein n=1 Tax=Dimargaris cristalligena TaxID=215637 RepID=A0A4Q0A348_9FUNG|nr:Translation machinery-associated protein 46 [Dimargaris cristalligena]RKP39660.1 hypothetical protein BJ085DRAFT_38538 [Dimargaris cristalligena]|eukprot:RKP39660.1 hypothetical protein BJ085DRAFT_38538 [Dimargaris cristalligena]